LDSAWSGEQPKAPLELLYWLAQDLLVPVDLLQDAALPGHLDSKTFGTFFHQRHLLGDMASTATSSTAVGSDSSRAQTEARAAVQASLESAGSAYDVKYQRRATDLHSNARAISKQEDQLKKNTAALAKESDKWQKDLDKATKGLNEFGDLQNWAEMMERDFLVLEETLRLVEGTEATESASGGSRWR